MPRGIIRLGAKDQKELLKWLGYSGAKIVGSRVFGPTKTLDFIVDVAGMKVKHGELPELIRAKTGVKKPGPEGECLGGFEEQEEEPKNIRELD